MSKLRRAAGIALIMGSGSLLQAAPLQWDADGVAPLGGTGTWDTTNAFWYNGSTYQAWINASNDDAVFNTTAGTVTLAEAITANSLTFDITGYTLAGGGNALTLGAGGITVNGIASTLGTVTTQISGTNGLTKAGVGILSIGTAGNYTGNTTVSGGTLAMGANNVFNASGLLDIASGARFNVYTGNGSGTGVGNEKRTQTFTGLTGGGTLAFGQGNTSAERFKINLATGDTQTFSGALVTAGFTGNNNRAVVEVSGSGTQIFSGTNTVGYATLTINTGSTVKIGSATAFPAFTMDGGSASGKLDLNGFNMGVNFGQGSTTEVTNSNSGQVSQLRHIEGNQLRAVSQKITSNIQLLANVSTNTMFLSNTSNTFTGGLQLDSGAIRYAAAGSLPAGTINFNGGRLEFGAFNGAVFNADVATDRVYKVQAGTGGEAGAFRSTTAAGTPSQIILRGAIDNATGVTSPGNLRFHGFGTSSQTNNATYTLHGGGSYSGQLIIGESTGSISSFTLRPGVTNGLPQGATLGFVGGPATVQTFNLNNFDQQIAGITNTASTDPVTSYSARVINTGAQLRTLTVANASANIFNGTLGGTGGDNFALTKSGNAALTLAGANTYTGPTNINDGVLEASVLANGGSDSSIGKSSNAATGLLFGAPTAILRYIGGADVTTDRGFTLSSGVGGGATIESSGAGTLSFDNTGALDYGTADQTRLLTLGGSNTGANTFSKVIGNNGAAATAVTKSGSGTWTLAGINTYDGVTTITQGILAISNASALGSTLGNTVINSTGSAVTGGRLSLNGGITVAENITFQGTGDATPFDGALTATGGAANTVSGTITLTGTVGYRFDASGAGTVLNLGSIQRSTAGGGDLTFSPASGASVKIGTPIDNNAGALFVHGGTVALNATGNDLGNAHVQSTGILKLGANHALAVASRLQIGNGAGVSTATDADVGTFDLAGFNQTIDALDGYTNTGGITAPSASRKITNSAASTTSLLTIGNANGSGSFDGLIENGAGLVNVIKVGTGTETLSGAQNYQMLTTSDGITNINGSFSGGTATVNANATTNFGASQTLAALNIGGGALVDFVAAGPGFASTTAGAFSPQMQAVPEPGTAASLSASLGLLLGLRRKRSAVTARGVSASW